MCTVKARVCQGGGVRNLGFEKGVRKPGILVDKEGVIVGHSPLAHICTKLSHAKILRGKALTAAFSYLDRS